MTLKRAGGLATLFLGKGKISVLTLLKWRGNTARDSQHAGKGNINHDMQDDDDDGPGSSISGSVKHTIT